MAAEGRRARRGAQVWQARGMSATSCHPARLLGILPRTISGGRLTNSLVITEVFWILKVDFVYF